MSVELIILFNPAEKDEAYFLTCQTCFLKSVSSIWAGTSQSGLHLLFYIYDHIDWTEAPTEKSDWTINAIGVSLAWSEGDVRG